jgi:hypothetical protein
MNTTLNKVLLHHGFVNIKGGAKDLNPKNGVSAEVGTILGNLKYLGYIPSVELCKSLVAASNEDLISWWKEFVVVAKEVTGDSKKMDKFVVFKNFPKEVLDKSTAEYWFAQILMYWGFPNDLFTEKPVAREKLSEETNLKVLSTVEDGTVQSIFLSLLENPSRWTDQQKEDVFFLFGLAEEKFVNLDHAKFKENGVELAVKALSFAPKGDYKELLKVVQCSSATDLLRLAAGMSGGDPSLKEVVKFKKFSRPERKFLLSLLNDSSNLMEDVGARPELFKKLFKSLHPGDYATFKNVHEVYDKLYNKTYETFNSSVAKGIEKADGAVLDLLNARPGIFVRKFHELYSKFDNLAVEKFIEVLPSLTNLQLLKMSKYLETINVREKLMFPPKGNWTKVVVEPNNKKKIAQNHLCVLQFEIKDVLTKRLEKSLPMGVDLGDKLQNIKLQTNDQELAPYGRGTVFDIPKDAAFIRSASYWETGGNSYNNIWYDNGWNFFNDTWDPVGVCNWDHPDYGGLAVFSGDPTNSKDLKGRACQMIDLYFDKLQKAGVKYAVWSTLCYSKIPFSKSKEVLATLQFGSEPMEGKLYEPSRAQMVFPLKGDALSKYIAYVDIPNRKLVYMDANLFSNVHSAGLNGNKLKEIMPAYVEYIDSLPSVFDLFKNAPAGELPVLYSDKNIKIDFDVA